MIRLDKYIIEHNPELTRNKAATLIENGNCTVNGCVVAKNYKVKDGDDVVLTIPEPQSVDVLPEEIPLDVHYEDEHIIVVNKPQGMIVHPCESSRCGTLVNALMYRCGSALSGINGVFRPGIVHRLDKDTSGLIAVAKSDISHVKLAEQFMNRTVLKEYEAVVRGRVKLNLNEVGEINAPIGRSVTDRKKMCVTSKGTSREAVTNYEVIANYNNCRNGSFFSHIRLLLETGRTHQIRVHMQYIGHSIAGDSVYGNGKPSSLGGQCLHAKKIGFIHPNSGEYIEIDSELPDYFTEFLKSL
jgi:23S rRNA pseudouridine1911/1915/1917 synthase